MPAIDYRTLRREIDIEAVLKLLGFVPTSRRGNQLRGPCPIHRSQPPQSRSFSANLACNVYRCFRCGSAGNQLDLWAAAKQMPLHQAAKDLCEKLRHRLPLLPRSQIKTEKSTLRG
jgi:DNA primase